MVTIFQYILFLIFFPVYVGNFMKEDDAVILVHTPERYNFVDASK